MAFGFLIERFDLFLQVAAPSLRPTAVAFGQKFANVAGLAFIVLGTVMIIIARCPTFCQLQEKLTVPQSPRTGTELDIALAVLLALLAAAFFYICPRPPRFPVRSRSALICHWRRTLAAENPCRTPIRAGRLESASIGLFD